MSRLRHAYLKSLIQPRPLRKKSDKGFFYRFFLREERLAGPGGIYGTAKKSLTQWKSVCANHQNTSWVLPFSQNDPPCVFLLVVLNKKKLRKAGHQNTPYTFGVSVKIQIVIARKKFKWKFKGSNFHWRSCPITLLLYYPFQQKLQSVVKSTVIDGL